MCEPTLPFAVNHHDHAETEGALRRHETPEEGEKRVAKLTEAARTILTAVGENPSRPGLEDTPERVARAMMFFTQGYTYDLAGTHVSCFHIAC